MRLTSRGEVVFGLAAVAAYWAAAGALNGWWW